MSFYDEVQSGLEGVVAFATEIAEPDREGSSLRYRGVDIEELAGVVPFEQVWGLLVDGALLPGLPPAEPFTLTAHTGDHRVDVQAAHWRCWLPSGISGRCWRSPTSRRVTTSPVPRSWRCPSSPSRRAGSPSRRWPRA